uniref:Glycosyltransferase family 10 fucosyltransferase n=1 Tax=Pithovirus LCPAC104 TaxID=2506589 RepID=A0A481Z658_9VIRU|nr:MAG: glycosyltransferase family 10 fucosyltransferase [Pithovirus LCPAC104]
MDNFIFLKDLDFLGSDIYFGGRESLDIMIDKCIKNPNCICFNTLGFYKNNIDISLLKKINAFNQENDGLYIYKKRLEEKGISISKYSIKEYFSPGYDLEVYNGKSMLELRKICDNNPLAIGFDINGNIKYHLSQENNFIQNYNNTLYIKEKCIKIKMLCNWTNSKTLCEEWNRMSKGNFRWNNIKITWEDNADYYVIINKPNNNEFFIPNRTIIFHMEPWCYNDSQKWGVKTWKEWSKPDETKFLQVRSHDKYLNNVLWQLNTTYNEFKTKQIQKESHNFISSICSSKYFDPGHIKRVDFIKYVDSKEDPNIKIQVFNYDNLHKFKNYMGPHPKKNKDFGMMSYKYYFMAENNIEKNFITEKLWEPIICECLCFYWGCPNASEYIDSRAFIQLDLNNFDKSFNIIKKAIENNEWEKRLEIIKREKQKILEYYNFFPTLERVINEKSKEKIAMFIHCCDGVSIILEEILENIQSSGFIKIVDEIFIINIGKKIDKKLLENNKIHVINYSNNKELYEKPTLNILKYYAEKNRNCKILYVHTKGISYKKDSTIYQNVSDWRKYMLYFLLEKHYECIELLNKYEVLGCNFLENPKKHFSGNFWWCKSQYIFRLPEIISYDRHDCEWWILSKDPVKLTLYNSNIDHYKKSYNKELYQN